MAIVVAPGQAVGQPDWDALAAQHGGTKSTTKLAPTEAQIKEAGLGGDDDPAFQQRPIYRYYFNDGTYVDARTAANGADYAVIDYKPSSQYTQANTAVNRTENDWHTEGTPDGQGGYDNSRPIMVRTVNGKRETRQLTGAELKDWNEAQQRQRNPGGKSDAEIKADEDKAAATKRQQEQDARQARIDEQNAATNAANARRAEAAEGRAVAEANKPTVKTESVTGGDGKPYTRITTVSADGKTTSVKNIGPDGKEVAEIPGAGVGNLKDLPTYTPDLTKKGAGLFDYIKQLDEYMASHPDFTWEKRQKVIESAQAQATQVANEFNTGAAILREQYQNETTQRGQDMTQANNRASLANTHTQNATALIEKFAPYLGVTPGEAGKLFMGMMASQLATATMYGGMKDVPRAEMDPRLTAFADRTVGAATTPPGTPGATPPNAPGASAPANPDAALAEAVRQQQAAASAPTAPAADPNALPPPLTSPMQAPGAGPTTKYRDQWGNELDLTQDQVNNRPGGSSDLTPVGAAGATAPINPPADQPGNNPLAPVGAANPAVQGLFANALPSTTPTSWREDAQARASLFDPMSPQAIGTGERLFGSAIPSQPYNPGFSLGGPTGPAPVALQSNIPGMTADIDAEARRQLALEGAA